MKKLTALLLMLALLGSLGCHNWPMFKGDAKGPPTWNPKAEDLVKYLNDNASRIQALGIPAL